MSSQPLESKGVAFITGAAQGIGKAIALRLAEDGYDVAINDIAASKEKLDLLSHEIVEKYKKKVCKVPGDVSVESEVEAMFTRVVEDLGGLDVMVANAGVLLLKPFLQTTVADWDRIFSVNVLGTFLCYKYAGQQMVNQGRGGRIIGASSICGKQGVLNLGAYCSSKFAVRGLTQAVATELGPHGITVNAYAPGTIDTAFLDGLTDDDAVFREEEAKLTVVGRIGTPAEIASLVSYLASKEARFITGQSISVNGGRFFD